MAYSFTEDFNQGFYWRSFPIEMDRFVTEEKDFSLMEQLSIAAKQAWEAIGQYEIWNYSGDVKNEIPGNVNLIRWSDNFEQETGFDGSVTLAIAIRYSEGPYFAKTEIILNGNNANLRNNSNNDLYKTILHELGHTIGLGHSEQFSIMQPFIGPNDLLTDDDQTAFSSLVGETLYRQSIGFTSSFTNDNQDLSDTRDNFVSCGTISPHTSGGPGAGMFKLQSLASLIIGLILSKIFLLQNLLLRKIIGPPISRL